MVNGTLLIGLCLIGMNLVMVALSMKLSKQFHSFTNDYVELGS